MKLLTIFLLVLVGAAHSQRAIVTDLPGVFDQADLVVVGEVAWIGEPPKVWSGAVLSAQKVRYRILHAVKGSVSTRYIDVAHYIVNNSETADAKTPKLNVEMFAPGNTFLLFLKPDSGKGYIHIPDKTTSYNTKVPNFVSIDANFGAIPSDEDGTAIFGQTSYLEMEDDRCDEQCVETTISLLISAKNGINTSWLEKSNREMGDRIILGIKLAIPEKEIFELSNVRSYLVIIKEAFADRKMIRDPEFRDPVMAVEFLRLINEKVDNDETRKQAKALVEYLTKDNL